ncbi:MAG: hypothetical protein FWB96_03710 [Defluviitaleaceae bacterium]|nr:hypothetical protein [Defluviitaleaceae bacterium]MCL2262141.1 hypothetical protein [Defluviitaleaceae bacterium]
MSGKTYDLNKLSTLGKFDIGVSTRFFYKTQDYFDALTHFVEHFNRELRNYTPAFVVNSDDNRNEFIKECFEIRAEFMRLGMDDLLEALTTLENAAISKQEKAFSDGQIKFRATINIYKDAINQSRYP